jgi:hypothetical protein
MNRQAGKPALREQVLIFTVPACEFGYTLANRDIFAGR